MGLLRVQNFILGNAVGRRWRYRQEGREGVQHVTEINAKIGIIDFKKTLGTDSANLAASPPQREVCAVRNRVYYNHVNLISRDN